MSDPEIKKEVVLKTKEKKNKVCIVGCGSSRTDVPWDDNSFEFWGVNNAFITYVNEHAQGGPDRMEKFTRWFEIHPIDVEDGKYRRRGKETFRGQAVKDYMIDLGGLGEKYSIPVYMQNEWPEIPNSLAYPIEFILESFPRRYFTNSVSYQIALAIVEGFEEIRIYGVDMAVTSKKIAEDEYSWQRPSCEYFIGIAEGKGIKVYLPPESDMLKARFLYGWDEPKENDFDYKLDTLVKKMDKQFSKAANEIGYLQNEIANKQAKQNQIIGAKNAITEIQKLWMGGHDFDGRPPWKVEKYTIKKCGEVCE